jgi:hypothetical protein
MGSEESPESMRRSANTTSTDGDEDVAAGDGSRALPAEGIETTLTMEGESLVDVLNYLNDPESHSSEPVGLELAFERDEDTSQQNHIHAVFQRLHQICKMADDSISISAVELTPEDDGRRSEQD